MTELVAVFLVVWIVVGFMAVVLMVAAVVLERQGRQQEQTKEPWLESLRPDSDEEREAA